MSPRLDKIQLVDLDSRYEKVLGQTKCTPFFIMGLHRSGTTFLYKSLAKVLPVAILGFQQVVFYPQLVHSYLTKRTQENTKKVKAYFAEHGLKTRLSDDIRLDPDTVEEYGFILKRYGGSFKITDKTKGVFEILVKKLIFTQPTSQAVLLKNPWDTGIAHRIEKMFPNGRFIFIKRDPIEILNSQLRNAIIFGSSREPLLYLVINGIPQLKILFGAQRLLYKLVGEACYSRIMCKVLTKSILKELEGYRRSLAALPSHKVIEISYQELLEDTPKCLTHIGSFLNLPVNDKVFDIQAKRRQAQLLPEIVIQRSSIEKRLRTEGLA